MSSFNGNGKHAAPLVQPQYEMGVLPPNNEQAEEAVLGSILLDPEVMVVVAPILKPEAFYHIRNKDIYAAMYALNERREPIDFLTVSQELRRNGTTEPNIEVYLSELTNMIATSLNVENYAKRVDAEYLRRRMLAAANGIVKQAYNQARPIDECIAEAGRALMEVQQGRNEGTTVAARKAVNELLQHVEDMHNRPDKNAVIGLTTGFADLDKQIGGLQKGDLIIVAARPGMGKSALMKDFAVAACKAQKKTMFFTLEMSNEQVTTRMVAGESGIPSERIKSADIRDDEWANLTKACTWVSDWPLWIDDAAALTIPALRAKVNRVYQQHGLDLIVVDYLQLMKAGGENRVQEIGEISMGLKQIAKEFRVPVVAGAQLSRTVEQRTDKRPMLSDLRESGSIEQDADIVAFIYRDGYYNEHSEAQNIAEIRVEKNRNGPTGHVKLFFDGRLTSFRKLARERIEL